MSDAFPPSSDRSPITLGRRGWLGWTGAAGLAILGSRSLADEVGRPVPQSGSGERPRALLPPYRAWFQPRCFAREVNAYAGMTLDASGWLDPKLTAAFGRRTLRWVYGTNHPDATGPQYWNEEFDRLEGWPGVAIDEWIPSPNPKMESWVAEGLRAGRARHPDTFVAVWVTDPTPTLASLVADGTVDLVLIENYVFAAARYGREATVHWPTALRRCDDAVRLGISAKSVFAFGHITADADADGRYLRTDTLAEQMREIRRRYPEMPGVAFFQDDSDDSAELREIVKACDRLSTELWPG